MLKQLLVVLCLLATQSQLYAAPQTERCVVLVSIDGLAGFYLDDPRAELPTLRRLAREGARADGMVCSFPTVTWPNHTTLVTGVTPAKHGVVGNNFVDRETTKPVALIIDPVFDKDQIVKTPTIYDVAHAAGLKTAGVLWPATRNAKTLNWTVPDMPGDAWQRYGTPSWLDELRQAGIPVDKHGAWCAANLGVQRDWLYVRMAAHALEKHQPNVLLLHIVEVDHIQHKYGPRSDEAYWSVSFADDRLRDVVEAIERSPRAKDTTLFVCSDHGFFPIEKEIRPNVVLRQLGLLSVENKQTVNKRALCLSQGGGCAVYVFDDTDRAKADRAKIVKQLADQLGHLEGVTNVILPAEFERIGQPTREQDPRGADFWLSAKSGYSFTDSAEGDLPVAPRESRAGTHGYLPEHSELLGTCVVWGAGVSPATKLGTIRNLDIAPTMAKRLGLEIPGATGKPLEAVGP